MRMRNTGLIRGNSTTIAAVRNTAAVVVVGTPTTSGLMMPSEPAGAWRVARGPTVPACAVLIWLQATGRQPTMPATYFLVGRQCVTSVQPLSTAVSVCRCACVRACVCASFCAVCVCGYGQEPNSRSMVVDLRNSKQGKFGATRKRTEHFGLRGQSLAMC